VARGARLTPVSRAAAGADALLATGAAAALVAVEDAGTCGRQRARELIVAIARMMLVAAAEAPAAAAVDRVLEREPGLIGVATLSGPLALALESAAVARAQRDARRRCARNGRIGNRAAVARRGWIRGDESSAERAATRGAGGCVCPSRGAGRIDALRRSPLRRRDSTTARRANSARLAALCAAMMTPTVPVGTAAHRGERTRVAALAAREHRLASTDALT
jgi:hypothetical protein